MIKKMIHNLINKTNKLKFLSLFKYLINRK